MKNIKDIFFIALKPVLVAVASRKVDTKRETFFLKTFFSGAFNHLIIICFG